MIFRCYPYEGPKWQDAYNNAGMITFEGIVSYFNVFLKDDVDFMLFFLLR